MDSYDDNVGKYGTHKGKTRGVFPIPTDFIGNIGLMMGWVQLFELEGKEFDFYRTLWRVILLCNRDKKSQIPIESKLIDEFQRYYCMNIVHDPELQDDYSGDDGLVYSNILSLYQITPLRKAVAPSEQEKQESVSKTYVRINGFMDRNQMFIGELPHTEWSQMHNNTLMYLEPIATDIKLEIMEKLTEHADRIPAFLLETGPLEGPRPDGLDEHPFEEAGFDD